MDPARLLHKLTHAHWLAADHDDRQVTIDALLERLPSAFTFIGFETHAGSPLAIFEHAPSGARFVLIPGGRFVMGFSSRERARVLELGEDCEEPEMIAEMFAGWEGGSPTREVDVAPFLLALEPLTNAQLERVLDRNDVFSLQRCIKPKFAEEARKGLAAMGLRLPSEAEWEYGCRAGTDALFPAGIDTLPNDPYLPPNGFGLALLGRFPELIADGFHPSYVGAPDDARAWTGDDAIVRGGAEMSWPWQGPGWIDAMCAVRLTLSHAEFFLSIRPAASLFADELAYSEAAKQERAAAGLTQRAAPEIREPEPEPSGPLVVHEMYGRSCGDLSRLRELDEAGAQQLIADIYAARFDGAGRYYSGENPGLFEHAIELLVDPAVPARHELALLLADLMSGGHRASMPSFDWRNDGVSTQDHCMFTLLGARTRLLPLLHDPDARVRASMALLLAPALQSAWGVELFYERLLEEQEPGAKASFTIAMGVAGTGVASHSRHFHELPPLLESADPLQRIALAHVLASWSGEQSEAEWLTILGDAIGTRVPEGTWLPWYHGKLTRLAQQALWVCGEPGMQASARGHLRRLRELDEGEDREARREATALATVLLQMSFEYHYEDDDDDDLDEDDDDDDDDGDGSGPYIDASTLSERQREILACLTGKHPVTANYSEFGIPEDPEQRRAWLGDLPAADRRS